MLKESVGNVINRNRSKYEIIAQILGQLREPTCKTKIMSHCNMSYMQSERYLSSLKSNNFVRMETTKGRVTFQRTRAGSEFLGLFNDMIMLLNAESSAV